MNNASTVFLSFKHVIQVSLNIHHFTTKTPSSTKSGTQFILKSIKHYDLTTNIWNHPRSIFKNQPQKPIIIIIIIIIMKPSPYLLHISRSLRVSNALPTAASCSWPWSCPAPPARRRPPWRRAGPTPGCSWSRCCGASNAARRCRRRQPSRGLGRCRAWPICAWDILGDGWGFLGVGVGGRFLGSSWCFFF